MKKTFSLIAAMLCCFPLYSQESEEKGGPELTVVARLEGNPVIPLSSNAKSDFGLGWSSLYTNLEGDLNRHLSYFFSNHWLSSDPRSLYKNTFRSDDVNWVDMANVTYTAGGLDVTIGKDMIAFGSFEMDPYDFEVHSEMASLFWNTVSPYQWAAKVSYTLPDESSSFAFQMATSPFAEKFFKGGLFSYSLQWTGSFGNFSTIWSTNFLERQKGHFNHVLALGNRLQIGQGAVTLDYINMAHKRSHFFNQQMSLLLGGEYALGDEFALFAKAGWEFVHDGEDMFGYGYERELKDGFIPTGLTEDDGDYLFAGAGFHWFPLKERDMLRVHTTVAYNNMAKAMCVSLGATFFLSL